MTYRIDQAQRVVHMTGSGALTDSEMIATVSTLRQDPDLEADMPTLSDMRDIEVAFTPQGVRQMLDAMHSVPGDRARVKAAIVVSSDVAFAMGRMFGLSSNDQVDPNFQIFRDMNDAEAWLGVRRDTRPQ